MQSSNRRGGLLKFAYQPNGAWRERGADLADHCFGVAAVENVEEEMSHNKVELSIGQNAGHCVGLIELDPEVIGVWQSSPCQIDHSGARFQDRDTGLPVILEQSRQESSIAFAQNQHAPSLPGVRKEIEAGVLQSQSESCIFQPPVTVCDWVGIHFNIRNRIGLSNTPSTSARRASSEIRPPNQNSNVQAPALNAIEAYQLLRPASVQTITTAGTQNK